MRWHRPRLGLVLLGCSLSLATPSLGAADYQDHSALTAELKRLAAEHADLVRVTKQAVSVSNREVWLVEVGTGSESERKRHPALLVVAGIEGDDLVGTVSAVQWVANLARSYGQEETIRTLLATTVLYVFPRLNPDAAESYFTRPRVERSTNATPGDDDHDGAVDEDGPEDLNSDGLVTWMRVQDPEGEYILHPADSRLLIKADKAKGEKGAWQLLLEGTDGDKDDQWNEDGLGGVNLNRNFPYNYPYFAPNAGWHPVSEPESRALADFVVAHPNIGIAFTFGAADNLVQTPKSEPGGKRPPKAISDADAPYYRELGQLYRDTLGLKKELTGTSEPGTFSDWIYFHRGRLGLAARPWTPQLQIELGKAQKGDSDKKTEPAKAGGAKPGDSDGKNQAAETDSKADASKTEKAQDDKGPAKDKRGDDELAALKWFDENAPEGFVGWQSFKHPDFPNQKVEIGGWAPFARSNPPAKLLDDWCRRQGKFLTDLAGKLPRIGVRKAEAKHLGSGIFEVTLQVENTGYLPTALAQGALSREVLRTRAVLKLDSSRFLSGQKTTLLAPIAGSGGMEELRYIIRGGGSLELEVISALGGAVRRTIELKEAP
jgi:hypothetical protein